MLTDPLTLAYGFTIGTPTGGTTTSYNRVDKGRFVANNGAFTSDQPSRLTVQPSIKPMGDSRIKLRLEVDKNLAPVNGVVQKDDTGYCEIVLVGNFRSFTQADFTNMLNGAHWAMQRDIAKLMEGQS